MAKPKKSLTAVERRAEELDTIASVLPLDRRDELAELLTDQDIETLRHLVNAGMGANTLRALTSDLAYLEAWGLAATGKSLPWPAPEALLLKFVAHHLWTLKNRLPIQVTGCQPPLTTTFDGRSFSNLSARTRQPPCVGVWPTGRH